jgi:hypothetical protein
MGDNSIYMVIYHIDMGYLVTRASGTGPTEHQQQVDNRHVGILSGHQARPSKRSNQDCTGWPVHSNAEEYGESMFITSSNYAA